MEIELIPTFPRELIEAAELGRLVPFVGAGVSRLAGSVGWEQFAARVVDCLVRDKVMSPLQGSQIDRLSPRLKLSLAEIKARGRGYQIPYAEILQPEKWKESKEGREIYSLLGSIARRFVTTNYDEWLDRKIPALGSPIHQEVENPDRPDAERKPLYRPAEINFGNFMDQECVVHLHGSVLEPDSMIITTNDYVGRYAADRDRAGGVGENTVLSFLASLFGTRNVLFVGYGLEELEILEYVILKSRKSGGVAAEARHFIIQGFYSVESDLCKALGEYYSQWGIQLIPFSRDDMGHAQLIEVIRSLADRIAEIKEPGVLIRNDMKALLNG